MNYFYALCALSALLIGGFLVKYLIEQKQYERECRRRLRNRIAAKKYFDWVRDNK